MRMMIARRAQGAILLSLLVYTLLAVAVSHGASVQNLEPTTEPPTPTPSATLRASAPVVATPTVAVATPEPAFLPPATPGSRLYLPLVHF
jgi:hypothetical protein